MAVRGGGGRRAGGYAAGSSSKGDWRTWQRAASPSPTPSPPFHLLLACSQRARELLAEGDQGSGGSGIKILLAALAAAPGLQTLLADAVVHRCVEKGGGEARAGAGVRWGWGWMVVQMRHGWAPVLLACGWAAVWAPALLHRLKPQGNLQTVRLNCALCSSVLPSPRLPLCAASWRAGPSSARCSSAWKPLC